MWPFRRRAVAPPPALTNEAYSAWLRAWQPPLQWFLSLSEIEQEQLATLGDQRAADLAVAIGNAVHDPQMAEAGVAAFRGDAGGEEVLVRRLAENFATAIASRESRNQSRMRDSARSPAAPPAPTLAGLGNRATTTIVEKPKRARRFIGGEAKES